jgi:hypothetical protein
MRVELERAGQPVALVGINMIGAEANQVDLTARCNFPLLQDLALVGAWDRMGGSKDDFLVYDRQGRLFAYLPNLGGATTNLSLPEGYANVKRAVLAALAR